MPSSNMRQSQLRKPIGVKRRAYSHIGDLYVLGAVAAT